MYVLVLGAVGVRRFLSTPYVLAPMTVSITHTRESMASAWSAGGAVILFAAIQCSKRSR